MLRSSKIMRGKFENPELSCARFDYVPDDFLRNVRSPDPSPSANTAKNSTMSNLRSAEPIIERLFYPIGHRHRADMPSFPYEVDNRPMILASLNVVEIQIDKFFPTETTTEKHG